ncbi:MAG: LCP family protein [Cryobacterium sp.]|nr:LCP family protein [Cryobacterium sp.]
MSELRPRGEQRNAPRTVARHGRLRSSGPVSTVLKFLAAAVTVVLVSGASVVGYAVWDLANSAKPGVALIGETIGPPPDIGAIEGGVNLLLVGSDSGEGDPQYGRRGENLNDVTILLHISADHTNATVVSFPRDLIVPIASCPKESGSGNWGAQAANKINVTLTYGGLPCVVKTVSDLTGLSIPFAAKIEFNGVIEMSNAIGGVTVCIGSAIHDGQIGLDLDAGPQTLSGWDALLFLRSRYGVSGGTDLARISNQQVFMSALVRQAKAKETLSDPIKVYALAKAAVDNMQVSNSLHNPLTLASIALAMKDIPAEHIQLIQYPSHFGSVNGINGVLPTVDAANVLFSAIKSDLPVQLSGTTGPGATLDPNAPVATPDPSVPSLDNVVTLPGNITGQSSAQETCSKGQTYHP